jgi:hypothetical protein
VRECLKSRPLEKCWEVAKHSPQGPEFEELGPQIAKMGVSDSSRVN